MVAVDWGVFSSRYVSFNKGEQHNLVLHGWRVEMVEYEQNKPRPALTCDVLRIDGIEYPQGAKIFRTGSRSFIDEVKPIIQRAESKGKTAVNVLVKMTEDRRFTVMDLEGVI